MSHPSAKTAPVLRLDSERLALRLAEMVIGLTECEQHIADEAVRTVLASDPRLDALEVVARATIVVNAQERPAPRVPAYVRSGPRRPAPPTWSDRPATSPAPNGRGSGQAEPPRDAERRDRVVVDLRRGPADIHLDLT